MGQEPAMIMIWDPDTPADFHGFCRVLNHGFLGNSMEYPPAIKRGWLENAHNCHNWGFNRKTIYRIWNFHTFRVSAQIPCSDVRDKTDKTADLFSEAPLQWSVSGFLSAPADLPKGLPRFLCHSAHRGYRLPSVFFCSPVAWPQQGPSECLFVSPCDNSRAVHFLTIPTALSQ